MVNNWGSTCAHARFVRSRLPLKSGAGSWSSSSSMPPPMSWWLYTNNKSLEESLFLKKRLLRDKSGLSEEIKCWFYMGSVRFFVCWQQYYVRHYYIPSVRGYALAIYIGWGCSVYISEHCQQFASSRHWCNEAGTKSCAVHRCVAVCIYFGISLLSKLDSGLSWCGRGWCPIGHLPQHCKDSQ